MDKATFDKLAHIAKTQPLGAVNNFLAALPPNVASEFAQLAAGMDVLQEGGRHLPFSPKRELDDIEPTITNAMRNNLELIYQRGQDEHTAYDLLEQMGSDNQRPVDTSPPTLAETVEAALTMYGVDDEP